MAKVFELINDGDSYLVTMSESQLVNTWKSLLDTVKFPEEVWATAFECDTIPCQYKIYNTVEDFEEDNL